MSGFGSRAAGSRAALDKQQSALRVEELASLLERVSPEGTEVITRIQSVLNIDPFFWILLMCGLLSQIVETLQDSENPINEQSLYHKLLLAVEGNRHNIIDALRTNALHYIAYLLVDAGTGDCQTRGLYLLLVWLCSEDGDPVAPRHDGEISLPNDEYPLQLRKKLVDKLSEIFHDGQRDDHGRKLAGKILVDMLLEWKDLSQADLRPLWMKFDSSPDNTVLGFFAGLITHRLLSSTADGKSAFDLVYTLRETPFCFYLEKIQFDPPKFLADISAMMGRIPIIYVPQQLPVPRAQVTNYILRSVSIDLKSLANNIVLAALSPTELTFIYSPADECNGYFEYLEISFPNPRYIHTSFHIDDAKNQHLVLYIDDAGLVSRNGQKQRGDKLTIRIVSSDNLSELKERLRSITGEDKQANRSGSMSRRSSSMIITLDSIEDIARKSLLNERAHEESLRSNAVRPDGAIVGTLLDSNQESHSHQETSHLEDAEITQASTPKCNMPQRQEQNKDGNNVMTMSPARKTPVKEQLEGVFDCSNGDQSKSPSVGLGLAPGGHISMEYEMMTPTAEETGIHQNQLTSPQKSKSPLQIIRVESPDRSIEAARSGSPGERHSHGLHLRRGSKRLLTNTQESLIFPPRRPKRKVYNLNSKAAVDWDEDLRPSDEADETEPPPKRLSRVGFTSVTSLISSPFPGDEPLFRPKPKGPLKRQKPTKAKSLATRKKEYTRKTKSRRRKKEEPIPKPRLQLDIACQTSQKLHDERYGDTEMTNDNGLCLTDGDEQTQINVLDGLPNLGIEVAGVLAETDTILVDVADTSKSMLCNEDGDLAGSTPETMHHTDADLGQSDEERASKVSNELNQNLSQDFEQRESLNEGRGLAMGKRLAAALRGSAATSHEAGHHDASRIDIDANGKIDNNSSLETVSPAHSATAQDVDIVPTAEEYNVDSVNSTCVTDTQVTDGIATPTLIPPEQPSLQYTKEVLHAPTEGSNRSDSEALNKESKAEKLRYSDIFPKESSSHAHSTCQTHQRPLHSVPAPRSDDCIKCSTVEGKTGLTATISPCERTSPVKTDTLPNIFRANSQAQLRHPKRPSEISRTTIVDGNGSPRLFPQTEHGHQSRSRYIWPKKERISPIAKCSSPAHSTSSEIVSQAQSLNNDLIRAFVVSREKLGIHSGKGAREKCAISRESTVARSEYATDYSSMDDSSFNTVDCTIAARLDNGNEATPPVLISAADAGLTQQDDRETADRVNKLSPNRDRLQVQPKTGQHRREVNNTTDHPVLLQRVHEMARNEFSASNKVSSADRKEDLLCQLEQERKTITEALETYRQQCHRVLDQLFEAQKEQIRVCREQMEGVQRHHADICREVTDRLEANERSLLTSAEWELFKCGSERPIRPSPRRDPSAVQSPRE
ncbi:hypothetical protein P168DRAFT_303888 [Aspergillus campestris IBT 28561]|uniref:Uncharacterized protein n=1 Tax=Aspergillus campestris (strain IBT 28561) TaxID=1392248 RepID=A0A2I1D4B2_ASPC2|nr:uncharacterized protein P168DRAFT_303888 [Aspergillus campestris IBT 28561]PKY04717.1 hypothetical protein P168DRAFT_303888 [Aspergillus campestris IBT 28561]